MNVTEALPEAPADGAGQGDDKVFAAGWAARPDLPDAVLAALPDVLQRRIVETVELGRLLALAERERDQARAERDDALSAAHRYRTAAERSDVDNRAWRERVARQHQTIENLRRQLALGRVGRVLDRVTAALDPRGGDSAAGDGDAPCACLARAPRSTAAPVRTRWARWGSYR